MTSKPARVTLAAIVTSLLISCTARERPPGVVDGGVAAGGTGGLGTPMGGAGGGTAGTGANAGGTKGQSPPADLGTPIELVGGAAHTCARFDTGAVRCWGRGTSGQLGYDSDEHVGDGMGPAIAEVGDVPLGEKATAIVAGESHTCALLESKAVRCWGAGKDGQLGYVGTGINGHEGTDPVGDGTRSIEEAGDVPIGGLVRALAAGKTHTCALLENGSVRCWGNNAHGRLGYGHTDSIGRGERTIQSEGDVPVGGVAIAIAAGFEHTCAVLEGGSVRCWGNGFDGRLGHDNQDNIGDGIGLSIMAAGDIPVGQEAIAIAAGGNHTCAILSNNALRCWGRGIAGQLGYGQGGAVGQGAQTILDVGDVPVGGSVLQVVAGESHTCARLTDGAVRCWGDGEHGALGYGNREAVGVLFSPIDDAGDVMLQGKASALGVGFSHSCAILVGGSAHCWGMNLAGQLGDGNTETRGDDAGEMPPPAIVLK